MVKKTSIEGNWDIKNGHITFHSGLVNLEILTVSERKFDLYYDTVTLKLIENESQCQKKVLRYF